MAASASSESQGKTIALVVFVILTIISGVVAFYFYDQVDTLTQERNNANTAAQDARRAETTAKNNYNELRGTVYGEQTEEDHTKVIDLVRNDLKTPRLGDARKADKPEYKSFKDALDFLHDQLAKSDTTTSEQATQLAELKKQIESLQDKHQVQIDEVTKDRDAKADELAQQSSQFRESLASKDQEIASISEDRLRLLNSKQDAEQELERFTQNAERKIRQLSDIIASKEEQERLRDQIEFESSDGIVTEVKRQAFNTEAYLNLGAADGIINGITFGVYGKDKGGNPYKLPKANAVVVRVLDSHRSIARVVERPGEVPVIPGDVLFNPLWSPGQQITVGIVGLVYLDDIDSSQSDYDLRAQNREFIDILERLGVKVVAQYDVDQQKSRGKIDINTDWLVIGEIPEKKETDDQERRDFLDGLKAAEKQFRTEARENDVRVINVRNLLTFMGKQQPRLTVRAGEESEFLYGKRRPSLIDEGPAPPIKPAKGTGNGTGN